jgi:hypothetical protein
MTQLAVEGLALTKREEMLIKSERDFLEKVLRLLKQGTPGVKQAKRDIASRLSLYALADDLRKLAQSVQKQPEQPQPDQLQPEQSEEEPLAMVAND